MASIFGKPKIVTPASPTGPSEADIAKQTAATQLKARKKQAAAHGRKSQRTSIVNKLGADLKRGGIVPSL